MSAEALAHIDAVLAEVFRDAALSEFERVDAEETHESLVPKANALATALRAARAEIVRLSSLIPEPPTDDEREALRRENGPLSIERLREIGNAATPGPWTYDGYGADEPEINAWAHRYIRNTDADASGLYREIATSEDGHGPNAEFIVHARNFWDELLDELEMWRNRHRGPITDERPYSEAVDIEHGAWETDDIEERAHDLLAVVRFRRAKAARDAEDGR